MPTTTPQHKSMNVRIRLTDVRTTPEHGTQAECGYCAETITASWGQSWGHVIIDHAQQCSNRRPAMPDRLTITEPRLSRVYLAWAVLMTTLFILLAAFGGK